MPGAPAARLVFVPLTLVRPTPPLRRRGVTLVELLVVLVILGIGGAIVVPAMRDLGPAEAEPSSAVVARDLAARRGESVRVVVEPSGAWRATAERDTTDAPLARGAAATFPSGTWTVTPVGLCLPRPMAGAPSPATAAWDPVRCAVATAATGQRP